VKRLAPMKMELALTHRCNLRCAYCYAGAKSERTMSLETVHKALDLAFDHPHEQVRIAPFGGEPLLEAALVDKVATEAKLRAERTGKKVRFTMTTNGTLLTDENLEMLARHGFRITVSLDGDREAHDAARIFADGTSSWEAVVAGLERAREHLGTRRTLSVVHPGNVRRIGESFECLVSLGVNQLSLSIDYSASWSDEDLEALRDGFEGITDRVIARHRQGAGIVVRPLHGKIRRRIRGDLLPTTRCRFGLGEFAVAPSGRLYPCERLIGADGPTERLLAIGHVDQGVDLPGVHTLRGCKNRRREECDSCSVSDQCMWWCGCVNHELTGRIDGVSGTLCETEQIAIAAADRLAATLAGERNEAFLGTYYLGREPR
jgi:uncharacterized protein